MDSEVIHLLTRQNLEAEAFEPPKYCKFSGAMVVRSEWETGCSSKRRGAFEKTEKSETAGRGSTISTTLPYILELLENSAKQLLPLFPGLESSVETDLMILAGTRQYSAILVDARRYSAILARETRLVETRYSVYVVVNEFLAHTRPYSSILAGTRRYSAKLAKNRGHWREHAENTARFAKNCYLGEARARNIFELD
jgi:hypothetical protein